MMGPRALNRVLFKLVYLLNYSATDADVKNIGRCEKFDHQIP